MEKLQSFKISTDTDLVIYWDDFLSITIKTKNFIGFTCFLCTPSIKIWESLFNIILHKMDEKEINKRICFLHEKNYITGSSILCGEHYNLSYNKSIEKINEIRKNDL